MQLLYLLGLSNDKLSYKQRAYITKLIREINSRINKYPNNDDVIIKDVIIEHSRDINKYLLNNQNKDCFKRAVAINTCLFAVEMEELLSCTISKKEIEALYSPSNILTHKDNIKKLKEKLELYENIIKEFVDFDTRMKQDGVERILNHEEIQEGIYRIDLKYLTFDLHMNVDTTFTYRNVLIKDNKIKEKEMIL